jgi:hypothetical protein
MPGIDLAHRLAITAIVNGLRKGGEVGEATIDAIAAELRAATAVSEEWGHTDTTHDLRTIAEAVENGGSGK